MHDIRNHRSTLSNFYLSRNAKLWITCILTEDIAWLRRARGRGWAVFFKTLQCVTRWVGGWIFEVKWLCKKFSRWFTPWGPSIKYVTLFLANFDPPPQSHFVTHSGTPRKYVTHLGPPRFLVVQKTRTKAPCTKYLSIVRGVFVPGVLFRVFSLEGFVRGGFCPFPFCQNTSITTES